MKVTVLKNNVPVEVVLVETPDPTERYEIYVGRSEDCHVRINDPLISRHHFVLKNDNGSWLCQKKTQVGSVTINGMTGEILPLKNNDEIKCGVYSLLVSEIGSITPSYSQPAAPVAPIEEVEEPSDISLSTEELLPEAHSLSDDLGPGDELGDLGLDSEAPAESEELKGEGFSAEGSELESDSAFGDSLGEDLSSGEESVFGSEEDQGLGGFDSGELAENPDGFGMDALPDEEEGTRVDRNFMTYQLILFGEHAPYDRYHLTDPETFIGRDTKKCQIILNDPEVSTVHAVLKKNGSEIILEDLNSSNGTILNGERINRAQLSAGDEFLIGSTSFSLEVRSELLDAEADRLMPVEGGQVIETEEIEEEEVSLDDGVSFEDAGPPEKSIIKRIWKNPEQRKKLVYGLVGLALVLVLFYEEDTTPPQPKKANPKQTKVQEKPKLQLSKELETKRNVAYELGFDYFNQQKYNDALQQFQIVAEIDPNYKEVQTFLDQTKASLKKLEELEAEKRAAEERVKTKKLIEELLAKAREAVKERQVTVAENYFGQITEKDPENIEVQQLKMELEAWQKEEERKKLEAAAKAAARKTMVDALSPGKTFYLKKEWYRAILKLEEFLRKKGMDEDLVKEASDMLSESKNQLASELGPVLGKARSLKEGQDLKAAYESFLEVLKLEPTNTEALNEVDDIRTQLDTRSKRIYREAIIAESLSLFNDAKEKFQEVQQISPTDSEYYRKASDKLRNYLE